MAEFETPEDLIDGCERAYAAGYRRMDAYAPMPVEGLGGSDRIQAEQCGVGGSDWRDLRRALADSGCCIGSQAWPIPSMSAAGLC